MAKTRGRPAGRMLQAEAFEAILAARNLLKSTVAAEAHISKQFLTDLLAHRAGASEQVQQELASALGVKVAAIFPEAVGWTGPLADRDATRKVA